ncbi:MAG: ATP-binding protein, partial [Verrucomicrobiota bacterium]
ATEVWLRLKCGKDSIVLEVEDNGRGFDPGQVQQADKSASASGRGHGLKNMEQRMRSVGGRFEQESRLGQGTVNRFILPLRS